MDLLRVRFNRYCRCDYGGAMNKPDDNWLAEVRRQREEEQAAFAVAAIITAAFALAGLIALSMLAR